MVLLGWSSFGFYAIYLLLYLVLILLLLAEPLYYTDILIECTFTHVSDFFRNEDGDEIRFLYGTSIWVIFWGAF